MSYQVELAITDRCNLGCKYCYVKNRNKVMTLETINKVIPKLHEYVKQSGQQKYSISYFGGEPLMNFDLIKEAYEIFNADEMCQEQCIISNGSLLNKEIYSWLKIHKIGFSWSFDGKNSNISRPLLPIKENKGVKNILSVYENIRDEILDISGHGVHAMIYPENLDDIVENFEYLINDWNIQHIGYSLVRDDIWTSEDVIKFSKLAKTLRIKYVEHLKRHENISCDLFDHCLIDNYSALKGVKLTQMCFAGVQGCGVSPSGEFYGCQRFATQNQFKLSDYNIKDIEKNMTLSRNKTCLKCNIKNFCHSMCAYSILRNNNEPITSVCDMLKIRVRESIELLHEMSNDKWFAKKLFNMQNEFAKEC